MSEKKSENAGLFIPEDATAKALVRFAIYCMIPSPEETNE